MQFFTLVNKQLYSATLLSVSAQTLSMVMSLKGCVFILHTFSKRLVIQCRFFLHLFVHAFDFHQNSDNIWTCPSVDTDGLHNPPTLPSKQKGKVLRLQPSLCILLIINTGKNIIFLLTYDYYYTQVLVLLSCVSGLVFFLILRIIQWAAFCGLAKKTHSSEDSEAQSLHLKRVNQPSPKENP